MAPFDRDSWSGCGPTDMGPSHAGLLFEPAGIRTRARVYRDCLSTHRPLELNQIQPGQLVDPAAPKTLGPSNE